VNRLPRSRGVPRWLALLLALSLLAPSLLAAQAALEATFADLKGEVEWSPAGSTQFQAAALNTVLHAGDRIRTSANSAARLAYYEGSATQLGDTTEVRIDALQQGADQNLVRLSQTRGITQGEVQQQGATATNYEVETPVSVTNAPPTTCPWVRIDGDGSTLVRNYVSSAARQAAPLTVPQIQFQPSYVPGPFGPVPLLQAVPTQGEVTPSIQTIADQQALNPCPFDGGVAEVPYQDVFAAADDPAIFAAADADAARLLLSTESTLVAARALVGEPPPIAGEPPSPDAATTGGGGAAVTPAPAVSNVVIPTFDGSPARPAGQVADQATLETVQPTVQWASGSGAYQPVPARQTVSVGDRVRTGSGAAARLTYFEGSATELSADTELTVQRLERSPGGNIVGSIVQTIGTTVSRVVQLTDPAASFEVDTPAATAIVRGTTPQVTVAPDGTTRVRNIPDGTGGLVRVQGKDPARTEVTLQPGQQTVVLLNQAPQPATGFSALLSLGGRSLTVRNTQGSQQRTVQVGPGQETRIRPGEAPSNPTTIGQIEGLSGALLANLTLQMEQRAQQRAIEQQQAAAQVQQAQIQGAIIRSELAQIQQQQNTIANQLVPMLAPIRITLTWGAQPRDLDAHLWVPIVTSRGQPAASDELAGLTTGDDSPVSDDALRLLSVGGGESRIIDGSVLAQAATATPTVPPTLTPTPTFTATPTVTATATPTLTSTPTFTPTFTPTSTPTQTNSPTLTLTSTPTPLATVTPVPTAIRTATPTVTSTATTVLSRSAAPGFTEVYFGNPGSLTAPPFAQLVSGNVTNGLGPETIVIQQLLPGQYTYAVQNHSNEVPLSQSGARVQVQRPDGTVQLFAVPPQGTGQWWTVFRLDGTTGEIFPINQISNSPPLPSAVPNAPPGGGTATPTATVTVASGIASTCQAIQTQPSGATCTASGTVPSNAAVGSTVQVTRQTTNGTTVSTETFPCGTVATNFSFACSYTTSGDPFQGATVFFTFALAGGGTTQVTLFTNCVPTQPQGVACRGPLPAGDGPYRATR